VKKSLISSLVFVHLAFQAVPAWSQESCSLFFGHFEQTKIENEYLEMNDFKVSRDLQKYSTVNLPFEKTKNVFDEVMALPEGSRWIDMGAGEARALVDGLVANTKIAEGIAIAYERPFVIANPEKVPGRFRYLEGDFVENMAKEGRLDQFVGKVDLITDVYGPLSYSEKIPPLLQIYFDLLKPGGLLIFNVMTGRIKTPVMNTGLMGWISRLPGVEFLEVFHRNMVYSGGFENFYSIKIKKIESKIVVPKNLETDIYIPGNPPERTFISR
jgi:hypothetical protein